MGSSVPRGEGSGTFWPPIRPTAVRTNVPVKRAASTRFMVHPFVSVGIHPFRTGKRTDRRSVTVPNHSAARRNDGRRTREFAVKVHEVKESRKRVQGRDL